MPLPIVQVDAFTAEPFAGNPAAICVLDAVDDAVWMQAVAREMNLSETAFLCRDGDDWQLRWFTPSVEVDLCGHATLAAAHHLAEAALVGPGPIRFHTASGVLTAEVGDDGWITMDFPALPMTAVDAPDGLLDALGVDAPVTVAKGRLDLLVEVADVAAVEAVAPDMALLRAVPDMRGVIVTAPGDGPYDLVSRFFAPGAGVDEDPVTGSAHCALGPWWAAKLGRDELLARQASARGGTVRVTVAGDRVQLGGQAVTTLRGALAVDAPG